MQVLILLYLLMQLYQNRNLILKGQNEECGNLWLGDFDSARNKRTLKVDKINAVITAGLGMKITYNSEIKHKILPLYDSEQQDIARYFTSTFQFIDEALGSGNVLIHCYAGVSRSTTILAAYLMRKNNWTTRQTLAMIKKLRFVIGPNRGFLNQLRKFQSNMEGNKMQQNTSSEVKEKKKSTQNINKIPNQNVSFVEGFLGYKRQSSVVNKNRSTVYQSKGMERSKTIKKD